MRLIIITSLVLFLGFTSQSQDRRNIVVPEEMAKLDFLIGEWDYLVKTYNRSGKVIMERSYFMTYEKEFNGMLIVANSGFVKDGKTTMGQTKWLFYEKDQNRYKQVNYDVVGNFNTYVGNFVNNDLVITFPKLEKGSDGVERLWRKTYQNISSTEFEIVYTYSEDKGVTWAVQWEQYFKRKS